MTRTITLITATVGAALLFAVPAWGDNWGADKPVSESANLVDLLAAKNGVVDSSIVAKQKLGSAIVSERTPEPQSMQALRLRSEGLNRQYGLGEFAPNRVDGYVDAGERIVESQSLKALHARSEGLNRKYGLGEFATINGYVDSHERAVPPTSTTPDAVNVSGGRDVEWPQVGIGFGIGIALVFGLIMALRSTRQRPLAH